MTAPDPQCRLVALVGLRASGKTTLGRLLAERLGWRFVDGDERIAATVGRPAARYLREAGEAAFRVAEAAALVPILSAERQLVLATGGGAVSIPEVRTGLRLPGVLTVWLQADLQVLAARAERSGIDRPPLTDADPAREFALLFERRRAFYDEVAHASLRTDAAPPAATLERLLQLVRAGRSD